MSDMYWPSRDFERTHELRRLNYLHPGYAAECWCGYSTGYRRLAFFAVMAHVRHRSKALRSLWVA